GCLTRAEDAHGLSPPQTREAISLTTELRASHARGTAQGWALPHRGSLSPAHCREHPHGLFVALWPLRRTPGTRRVSVQLPKHMRKTVIAHTMADLPPGGVLGTLPAESTLAPGAHDPEIPLAGQRLVGVPQHLLGDDKVDVGVVDQLATTIRRLAWGRGQD